MTVNVNDTIERYTISGVGPYPFSFRIFADTDLQVNACSTATPPVPQPLTYLTHYTVTGANVESGGAITLTAGAATTYAGYTLDIRTNTPETQPTSIRNIARFLPEIHEDAYDNLSRQIQDLNRRLLAAVHLPDNEILSGEVEPAAVRKGRYLFWDAVTGAVSSAISLTGTVLSQAIFNAFYFLTDDHKRTAAEIAAGVTPVNYQYSPDHIGDDVRRYGNIDLTGATDCRAILNTANSVGNSLYFPKGTYRVSSNLTLSVACVFDYGAILKPDAAIVISFTNSIVAGPWKIFDVSNTPSTGASSIQTGVAPIAGLAKIPIVFAEWFGAVGDGVTNDYRPLQAALNFCMAANFLPLQLLARTYFTNTTLYGAGTPTTRTFGTVSIYGISGTGTSPTILTDNGALAHQIAILQYRNSSSNNTHGEVSGIYFTSDLGGDAIGIEFNGTCQFRVTRCKFGTNAGSGNTLLSGIRYNNDIGGVYTEFCIASNCEFWCDRVIEYVGGGSYHGSGLDDQCTATLSAGGTLAIINAGAQPYNSPMDVAVWTSATTTLVISNNAAFSCSFFGRLGLEVQGGTATLGGGQIINFAGPFACNSTSVVPGTFVFGERLVQNAGTNTLVVGGNGNFVQAVTTGANTLASHPSLYAQTRLVYIRLTQGAPAYDYRYLLLISPFGGTSVTLGNADSLNTAGFGAPAFSINGGGQLVVTNAGFPASGVTAYYRDICIDSLGIQV